MILLGRRITRQTIRRKLEIERENTMVAFTKIASRLSVKAFGRAFPLISHHIIEESPVPASREALRRLRGVGRGRQCLIVGTAPSARELDFESIGSDYILTLNRAYTLFLNGGRQPDGIVLTNPHAMSEYGRDAVSAFGWKHIFLNASAASASGLQADGAIYFHQWKFPTMDRGFFQFDASRPLYQAASVAHSALQLAVGMGFDEIILAGIDLQYSAERPHFYHTSGSEKERVYTTSQKNQEMMIAGMACAKRILSARKSPMVLNCGDPDGANPFDHVSWRQVCKSDLLQTDLPSMSCLVSRPPSSA